MTSMKTKNVHKPKDIFPIVLPHLQSHFSFLNNWVGSEDELLYEILGVRDGLILANSWGLEEEIVFNTCLKENDSLKKAQNYLIKKSLAQKPLTNESFASVEWLVSNMKKTEY